MSRILVFGSLNIDLMQRVPRLAVPGETMQGGELAIYVGGKGANQACAAAKLGGNVRMLGKVGKDVFAGRILNELESAHVRTDLVATSQHPSGTAVIFVLPNGDNSIVISAGANGDISEDFALKAVEELGPGDALLCQLETPLNAVAAALQAAHKKGVTTILDPAPARALPDALLSWVTLLTPNQTEAAILLGKTEVPQDFSEAASAARSLQGHGAHSVIVKMGAAGCWIAETTDSCWSVEGHRMKAIDTTAAGDTFNGALAASLARGSTLADASRFANAAAALSVTKPGAIPSIPDLKSVEELLRVPVPASEKSKCSQ